MIFDLDETLIHSVDDIHREKYEKLVAMHRDGNPVSNYNSIGFNIRPWAVECVKAAKRFYQVILWTASNKPYADAILNYLDPKGTLFEK